MYGKYNLEGQSESYWFLEKACIASTCVIPVLHINEGLHFCVTKSNTLLYLDNSIFKDPPRSNKRAVWVFFHLKPAKFVLLLVLTTYIIWGFILVIRM